MYYLIEDLYSPGTYYQSHPEQITTGAALSTPTGLTASNITSDGFTLSWNAVQGAQYYLIEANDGSNDYTPDEEPESFDESSDWALVYNAYCDDSDLASYLYDAGLDGENEEVIVYSGTSVTFSSIEYSDVLDNDGYISCRVRAVWYNPLLNSSWSSTLQVELEEPVTEITESFDYVIGTESAIVSWTNPESLSELTLKYREYGDTSWEEVFSSSDLEYLNNLSPNTTYEVCYVADGYFTQVDTFTTATVLSAPTGLTASNITADSFTLSWNAVQGANYYLVEATDGSTDYDASNASLMVGSDIWGGLYELDDSLDAALEDAGFHYYQSLIIENTTSATFYDVSPDEDGYVNCKVRAIRNNPLDASAWSSVLQVELTAPQLDSPTGLVVDRITSTSARIGWNSVSNAVDYKIEYRVRGTTAWTEYSNV